MRSKLIIFICCLFQLFLYSSSTINLSEQQSKPDMKLYGYAAASFKIGTLLFYDKLNNQQSFNKNWIVQQSKSDLQLKRFAKIDSGKLVVHDPRGCTIWFKNKMEGNFMISYKVIASSYFNEGNNILPRDINQFWMANTPNKTDVFAKCGLFDSAKYDGEFKPYDDLIGYYASTGGGNITTNNRTTRMRRYPRSSDGKLVNHVGLNNRDDDTAFLIKPNKEHLVQLVAANDIVQYIFDGKVVYEIKKGDVVDILNDSNKNVTKGIWDSEPWTSYQSGYFGFRMTRTHHVYSDFKVFNLIKVN